MKTIQEKKAFVMALLPLLNQMAQSEAVKFLAEKKEEITFADLMALSDAELEGLQKLVHVLRVTVIGVECDEDIVALGQTMSGLGEDNGTERHVLDRHAGCEFSAAGADLDDAVTLRFGKGLERTVDGGQGGDVDGRVGVVALLGGIEHGAVLGGCGDGHVGGA